MKKYDKWIGGLFLLLGMSIFPVEAQAQRDLISYHVTPKHYVFSTLFDMATDQYSVGSVVKSWFHLATHYDSYDRFGLYEGQGICSLIFSSIDIYNVENIKIGIIKEEYLSKEPTRFSFYDAKNQCIAIGYMNQEGHTISLVDPEHADWVFARLNRHSMDKWDVVIYYPEQISPRLVKIFAAFICDTQSN